MVSGGMDGVTEGEDGEKEGGRVRTCEKEEAIRDWRQVLLHFK